MRNSAVLPGHRLLRPSALALEVAGLVLILAASGLSTAPSDSERGSGLLPAVSGACLGSSAPTSAAGTLVLRGNATPAPSLSGVKFQVDYFYTEITKTGNSSNESCLLASASNTSGPGGSLMVQLPIPADRCNPPICVEYLGPYGPLGYATTGAPAGFFELDPTAGTSPGTIDWDADLYAAMLNMSGTKVVSTNAPVEVSATAVNALGAPAAGPLAYLWNLAGLEWGISTQSGSGVTVEGTDSGWIGSLSVTVKATFGSTTESVQSPVLSLVPVPTRVLTGNASPTPVDPGVPVSFLVTGAGAAGYEYVVTVTPGLGAGSASAPCTGTPLPNGTENLTCVVQATYLGSGAAVPTAAISNGYSTGQLVLGSVPVHPVEQVNLVAPSLVTYPNRTTEFTVNVTDGTGSAPYGPVCLSVASSPAPTCQPGTGTHWEFNASFPAPGEYEVRASVVDHFGENVSSTTTVAVVPFLTAHTNGSSAISLFANETSALSVVVTGGALPITMWWNLTGPASTLCLDNLAADGTISCPYPTSFPGVTNLTVSLRDALGTEASVVFRITVTTMPSRPAPSGGSGLSRTSEWILGGVLTALTAGVLLVAWDVRRRLRTPAADTREARVAEHELERMARGRDHLLSRSDPEIPRRPGELVAGWTGPSVAPEEWAEWIAALVADGSLIPSRAADRRLTYRRAVPHRPAPTIEFDPTVLNATPPTTDDEPGPPDSTQGGG